MSMLCEYPIRGGKSVAGVYTNKFQSTLHKDLIRSLRDNVTCLGEGEAGGGEVQYAFHDFIPSATSTNKLLDRNSRIYICFPRKRTRD